MSQKFPAMKFKALKKIVEHHCGPPVRYNGSHHIYKRKDGKRVLLAKKDEYWGIQVRAMLVVQLGLTEEEALKEVS